MRGSVALKSPRLQRAATGGSYVVWLSLSLLGQPAIADELIPPPVCSPLLKSIPPELKDYCKITTLPASECHTISTVPGAECHKIKVNLTANSGPIDVGGYKVTTEHYNNSYLTPVIEAMPGDTVAAQLVNALPNRTTDCGHMMDQGAACPNPTNLHYFHGGIVSPQNDRPRIEDARDGIGDNVYVWLKNGSKHDFDVPIPGKNQLDARVLESEKSGSYISHPDGLNWYHSHLHEISSRQVIGGMSGLLSVGDAKANVKACKKNTPADKKCLNPVDQDTDDLKAKTVVQYALLRDIPLHNITALPEDASGANAEWAPEDQDFPSDKHPECGVWKKEGSKLDLNPTLRKGFCQFDEKSAWLFTLNGQRFPAITLDGNHNLLLRIGNVSANVAYLLELCEEAAFERNDCAGSVLRLTILSLDGVVPARPVSPDDAKLPVKAFDVENLLLMPASRAEIYVRNDNKLRSKSQTYVLRTRGLNAGTDKWPAIALARIVLQPNSFASEVVVARNAPVAERLIGPLAGVPEEVRPPEGCVRDLESAQTEYRRVTFNKGGKTSKGKITDWSITTQIVHPKEPGEEGDQPPVDTETVGPFPFEEYVLKDGLVDWTKQKHVCIFIDHVIGHDAHKGSHKQLWVLDNSTSALHNFHIHQIKFRLATKKELEDHHIMPPTESRVTISGSDIQLYDEQSPSEINPDFNLVWHDTIPVPPLLRVFLIMSFDAEQQVGRFVYHCHILKHEDKGLMAPIEVWSPTPVLQ